MGNEAEKCCTVGSLVPFRGPAADDTVTSRMEDNRMPIFRQGTRKNVWNDSSTE